MTTVTIPEGLWEADSDGVLGTWFYNNGETVHAGRVIAEQAGRGVHADSLATSPSPHLRPGSRR